MMYRFSLNESCKIINLFGNVVFEAPKIEYEELDEVNDNE